MWKGESIYESIYDIYLTSFTYFSLNNTGDTCNGGSFEHGDICAEDTYDEGIADQQLGYENTENDVYVETVHGAVARDSYGDNNKDFTG